MDGIKRLKQLQERLKEEGISVSGVTWNPKVRADLTRDEACHELANFVEAFLDNGVTRLYFLPDGTSISETAWKIRAMTELFRRLGTDKPCRQISDIADAIFEWWLEMEHCTPEEAVTLELEAWNE